MFTNVIVKTRESTKQHMTRVFKLSLLKWWPQLTSYLVLFTCTKVFSITDNRYPNIFLVGFLQGGKQITL